MKQILLFVAMLVLASYVRAMAETYEVDGIYYTTSLDAVSAMQVTHGPNGTGSYSGNVVVPERVTIDGHSMDTAIRSQPSTTGRLPTVAACRV